MRVMTAKFRTILSIIAKLKLKPYDKHISSNCQGLGLVVELTCIFFFSRTRRRTAYLYIKAVFGCKKPKFQKKIPHLYGDLNLDEIKKRIATAVCKWRDESNEPNQAVIRC